MEASNHSRKRWLHLPFHLSDAVILSFHQPTGYEKSFDSAATNRFFVEPESSPSHAASLLEWDGFIDSQVGFPESQPASAMAFRQYSLRTMAMNRAATEWMPWRSVPFWMFCHRSCLRSV